MSPRDFITNYLLNEEADGTIVLCLSSENCHYDYPPVKGVVRGFTALSGFVIKPDPKDPNKCTMSQLVEVDLKGFIPGYAMTMVLKD